MMCTHFNDHNGCGGCNNIIKSVSAVVDGDNLVIKLPNPTLDVLNKQQICFCIVQPIPEEITSETTVIVQLGGTVKLTAVTKCGNLVHADQLKARRLYHTTVATDTSALMFCERELRRTRFVFPSVPVVPAP